MLDFYSVFYLNLIIEQQSLIKLTMKKILLSACVLAMAAGASAQIFLEDFEGVTVPALPSGWTQATNSTDGGWQSTNDYSSAYYAIPAHTRYAGTNDDICNCDKAAEKLISPAIAVPASGVHVLSFEYTLGAYYGEYAELGISTDGGATFTVAQTLAATNGSGAHVWTAVAEGLAAYAGQTINVVFNYEDNAGWGSGLMIDDVSIDALANVDMEMTAITTAPTVAAGAVSIEGTVTNLGAANITSIDITWNDGTGPYNETFTVNLNFGDAYNFTHGTALTAVAGNNYAVDVTVVATGDADGSNDMLSTSISAVSVIIAKVTVGEEKTGEWCGWCPRGNVAMAEMAMSNPSDFIGIAVHNADPMAIAAYDSGTAGLPGFTGYPHGGVDRMVGGDPSTFASMHAARASEIPPASITVTGSYDGSNVTVNVTADFVGGLSGDYRLAAVLLEDDVDGEQENYYSGGGSGALSMPNGGSMPNFDFATGAATVNPFQHDHVAIALADNQYNGAAGSLPATITVGASETHTYTIAQNASWNMANVHMVGMLINASTEEILNAGKGSFPVSVEELANNFKVNAYPNPTSGFSNIVLDVKEAGALNITVVNMLGEVVYTVAQDLGTGSFITSVDLSNNANGMYFANISLNGKVQTIKINVAK
jgi:hypothetical protein